MTSSEEDERVMEILAAARRKPEAEREAYLRTACAGDEDLRREVVDALSWEERMGGFLQQPVALIADGNPPPDSAVMAAVQFPVGLEIGQYRIESKLGEGGMSTVWLAFDTRLGRRVAIKFLSDDLADAEARRHFQREAQMASSLNHPHIVTVYDIGEFEGRQYLVTEYVDGGTLKDWVKDKRRTPKEVAELLTGVADGLAAAHQAGILHRDIKPMNILVARNGYAKLADFGLAKLAENGTIDLAARLPEARTRPGLILGTIAYMSPEQASGQPLDSRSDIFSFGVVLYEMLSGKRPFGGRTDLEVLKTIIDGELPPLSEEVPDAYRNVVEKALEKSPAERYQSMREMVVDLRRGQHDRESTASGDQDQIHASPEVNAALPAAPTRPLFAKGILIGLSLLAIIAAGLLGYGVLSTRAKHTLPKSQFPNLRITQLTSLPGQYGGPAFSPDGKQIAFIWDGENPVRGDLYLQWVGGEKPLRLTHTSTGYVCCTDWSPDGRQIIFGRCDDHGGGVFTIPALGGSERKLTDVVCQYGEAGDAIWTADGKSLVLADSCTPGAPPGIVVFSLQTGEKRCLHSPSAYDEPDGAPTLSPDQRTVAFLRAGTGIYEIDTVAFSGGNLRQLTREKEEKELSWPEFTLMWSPDGKYIEFEHSRDRMARVPALGGPIEFNSVYPRVGTLSRDGRRLAYVEPASAWRVAPVVWRAKLANAGGNVVSQSRVLVSAAGGNSSAQLSPSGRYLAFHSSRSGTDQIWRSNADGSDALQLTSFDTGFPGTPRWSPDEKWIVFDYRNTTQRSQIYLIDSEGRNLRRLSSDDYVDNVPSWSRDGKAVYFASNRSGDRQVWRREISTGKETQITQHGGFAAFESYDAKTLYYSKFDRAGIWKIPVGGGHELLVTDSLHLGYWGHYAVTDNGLYLVDTDAKGGPAIMYYNFQTRRLSPILTFEKEPALWTPNLAASRDGRTLFYAQVEFENSTISMAENFQ